jgi:hypothetical protein
MGDLTRLTVKDWQTIGDALNLLEASVDDDLLRWPGEEEDDAKERVDRTSMKVWQRLRGHTHPGH